MNRLWGMRAYLCGPMDCAPDGGVTWRRRAVDWLEARGCVPFDPTDKPIDVGGESAADRARRQQLLAEGRFDELTAEIKQIRGVDLRMVDITDFVIVYLDRRQHPCGTYEELFLANREMKPVLVVAPHGFSEIALWIFGTLPHQHLFTSFEALYEYLDVIDRGDAATVEPMRLKRWYFFDQQRVHRILLGGKNALYQAA